MPFYEAEAAKDGFEAGVRASLEAILASPLLHLPPREGADRCALGRHLSRRRHRSRVAAVVLPLGRAARPGADRRRRAQASCRRSPASRSRRAACSPIRASSALADRFAAQWLRLQDVEKVRPDPNFYPNFDENLADAMRTETKLFFDSLVKEDRSVLDLLTRRLHVPQRASREPLRHRGRHRHRVPPRAPIPTRRAAASSARARCSCRPRSPTAPRRCCAASG